MEDVLQLIGAQAAAPNHVQPICLICQYDVEADRFQADVLFLEGIPLIVLHIGDNAEPAATHIFHRQCVLRYIMELPPVDQVNGHNPPCPICRRGFHTLVAINFQLIESVIPNPEENGRFTTIRTIIPREFRGPLREVFHNAQELLNVDQQGENQMQVAEIGGNREGANGIMAQEDNQQGMDQMEVQPAGANPDQDHLQQDAGAPLVVIANEMGPVVPERGELGVAEYVVVEPNADQVEQAGQEGQENVGAPELMGDERRNAQRHFDADFAVRMRRRREDQLRFRQRRARDVRRLHRRRAEDRIRRDTRHIQNMERRMQRWHEDRARFNERRREDVATRVVREFEDNDIAFVRFNQDDIIAHRRRVQDARRFAQARGDDQR